MATTRTSPSESRDIDPPHAPSEPRERLLEALPVQEHLRDLAGIQSSVLAGGDGPPLLLLHGPGAYAAHWMRVIPDLVRPYRVIAPDLPGHGRTAPSAASLDASHVLRWLEDLVAQTCDSPPILVGELVGGAIAARFAASHPDAVKHLVLVDSFGLQPFAPAPDFAVALREFAVAPSPQSHQLLWGLCARDLPNLRRALGPLWEPFEAYNVERARSPGAQAAVHALMVEFGLPAIDAALLSRITAPTTLIWGRHDLATPVAIAEAASARYGWPLHVIDGANDAPAMEQPEAFVRVLFGALARPPERPGSTRLPKLRPSESPERVDTLVIGGGQAGLSTSYWLTRAGIEHLVLERQTKHGGAWHERWDSFHLVAPNFTLLLPGMPYSGPEPDAFSPRSDVIDYVQAYAKFSGAPVRLGCNVERLASNDGAFEAHAGSATFIAQNVVLATGPYQRPKVPQLAQQIPSHIRQIHSNDYRRPAQLPEGGVLVVGTGQSGTQIAEELLRSGRDVHLAVSMCPSVPRRYRGRDVIWWLLKSFQNRERLGLPFPTVDDLPTPAARFACNPHCSGTEGGHDIHLRQFARRGMHLYGRLESAAGSVLEFSGDLAERLEFADTRFDEEFRPLFDAYITAAGIQAPADDRAPRDRWVPPSVTQLDLDAAGIRCIVWATGYSLDFRWVDLPIFDQWGYPRHRRGVTEFPGLYAVGLPWLYSEPSSVFAGVGADAAHVVEHLARHRVAPSGQEQRGG